MPRIPNTRPTSIYWLFDTRTNVPFYCAKTVKDVAVRLVKHRSVARECPHRKISIRLNECGDNVRVQVVEIVSPSDDWAVRERYWISTLRLHYPDAVNATDGGQGAPGYVRSASAIEKARTAMKGRKCSVETRAKIGAGNRGKTHSPETLAKLSVIRAGQKRSPEARARMSAAQKGCPGNKGLVHSTEARANMRAAALRREQNKKEVGNGA